MNANMIATNAVSQTGGDKHVRHRCGHIVVHQLAGSSRQHEAQASNLSYSQCPACKIEAEARQRREAAMRTDVLARIQGGTGTIDVLASEVEATVPEVEIALKALFAASEIEYVRADDGVRHYYVGAAPETRSKGDWAAAGYKPRPGETPYRIKPWGYRTRSGEYHLYTTDQVVPIKRRAAAKPAVEIDVLAAVFTITRYAKRCRDAARRCYEAGTYGFASTWRKRKDKSYALKGQALHYLVAEGRLAHAAYHRFGGNWAEVLEGEGFRFHRPCPAPEGVECNAVAEIEEIEAKPRGAKEPRLKDAMHTLELYLADKGRVEVYEWPARARSRRLVQCWNCGGYGHIAAECDDPDDDDDDDWSDDLD